MEIHRGESIHHPLIIDCCMDKEVLGTYFIYNEQIHFRPLNNKMFNEIVNVVGTEYNITNLTLQTRLLEDLGFESDNKKIMLIKLDTLTGRKIPLDIAEDILTIGDIIRVVGEVLY
jgi:acyl carrier protein